MTPFEPAEVERLDDLPDEVLARFLELLAEAKERRPMLWGMPARCLADMRRTDIDGSPAR